MTTVIFGVNWSALKDSKYRHIPTAIEQSNVRIGTLIESPALNSMKGWKLFESLFFKSAIFARNSFLKFVSSIIRESMRVTGKSGKGAFALLTTAKDPQTGESLDIKELSGESATLVVAGQSLSTCLSIWQHKSLTFAV